MSLQLLPEERTICPECLREDTLGMEDTLCAGCGKRPSAAAQRLIHTLGLTAIQALGWPGHGKSTFLAALTLVLRRIGMVWNGFFCSALTESSHRKLRELNTYLATGALPPPTAEEEGTVLLLLKNAAAWGDRLLVYRDCPGELFEGFDVEVDRLPLLQRAPVVFLILSLTDLKGVAGGRSLEMLMETLVHSLEQLPEPARQRRCAVVVLTKADAIPDLPPLVRNYLIGDRLWAALDPGLRAAADRERAGAGDLTPEPGTEAYRERMAAVGEAIQAWLETVPAGRNLVRMAENHDLALRFCAVSATGSQADDNGFLSAPWHPRRVLDPLLWALDFDPRRLSFIDLPDEPVGHRTGAW
jgi:Double-GTPase 2